MVTVTTFAGADLTWWGMLLSWNSQSLSGFNPQAPIFGVFSFFSVCTDLTPHKSGWRWLLAVQGPSGVWRCNASFGQWVWGQRLYDLFPALLSWPKKGSTELSLLYKTSLWSALTSLCPARTREISLSCLREEILSLCSTSIGQTRSLTIEWDAPSLESTRYVTSALNPVLVIVISPVVCGSVPKKICSPIRFTGCSWLWLDQVWWMESTWPQRSIFRSGGSAWKNGSEVFNMLLTLFFFFLFLFSIA